MDLAALALALIGFAALALSMRKHHCDVFGVVPSRWRALALRFVGWTLLGSSLAACVAASGRATGPVLWFGVLTVAAVLVVLSLACRPRMKQDSM